MPVTFTIPFAFLRVILREVRRRPYLLAVGEAGTNMWSGSAEFLARSFRFVHEGTLRRGGQSGLPRFEIGVVPFTLARPDVWRTVAVAAAVEDNSPAGSTCSILLGTGDDLGLFTGIVALRDHVEPVQHMKVVGPEMRRLAAVGFRALRQPAIAETERWSRLIGALGGREVWDRLVSLSVCVVGVGRTGSLVAVTLGRLGVRSLTLIDPDVLEPHNLDAMDAVTERDLGRFKAEAVAESIERDLPHAQVIAVPVSVMTAEARTAVKAADVVVSCVDDEAARLVAGGLACCYLKVLLDIGTGILGAGPRAAGTQAPPGRRVDPAARGMGADVRLILPGDGCLLCWGGVGSPREALERWRTGWPRRRWDEERAGSLRSLNQIAAHLGIRLLEDLVAGRLRQSVWLRFEVDERGMPTLRTVPPTRQGACRICSLLGIGDLLGSAG